MHRHLLVRFGLLVIVSVLPALPQSMGSRVAIAVPGTRPAAVGAPSAFGTLYGQVQRRG